MLSSSDRKFHGPFFVDCHVHLHACFPEGEFLDSASESVLSAAGRVGAAANPIGVLMLTESSGVDRFSQLRRDADAGAFGAYGEWVLESTSEEISVTAERGDGELIIVSGRQIRTRERLEVLALGTRVRFDDGHSLDDTVDRVLEAGALPVIPWGFGKWWFWRGRVVGEVLETHRESLFVGDIGGRARALRTPRLLERARASGITVLPGSDPFPFPDQVGRVGSCGVILDGSASRAAPGSDFLRLLRLGGEAHRAYRQLQGLAPFLAAQLRMQLRARTSAG